MKTRTHVLVVLLATLLVAGSAAATPQIDSLVAGNGLAFSTDFAYDKAFIRITGPNGLVHDTKIAEGGALGVTFDRALVDGKYGWQVLVVEPISADIQAAMLQARNRGEKNLASKFNVASHTFTGVFSVQGGAMSAPAPASLSDADIPTKDIVQNDDVIMTFSLCVGNDCVNGESFGFDTMRLKENNLRIHFDDTSNSASFPQNDWRIEVNDTSNGGTNHWSVVDATGGRAPFRIEAGASANALVVESDSDIGIGTKDPVVELHVVDGDSPTLRLEQNGSSGFTPQTFDMVSNEANFFIRDVTNGSQLPFRIKPGADSDLLFLDSDNQVGLFTDSPRALLHARLSGSPHTPSNNAVVALFQNNANINDGSIVSILAGTGSANAQIFFGDTSDDKIGRVIYRNGSDSMGFWTNGTEQLVIENTGNLTHASGASLTGGVWTDASSRELKTDIESLGAAAALEALAGLEPVSYRYKRQEDETYLGFIAEDVPELVAMGDRKGLAPMDIVAVLTKVVQDQQKAMDLQQQTIEALSERLEAIENVD